MELSKGEVQILEQVANGSNSIQAISTSLNRSKSQIYVYARNLVKKNLIGIKDGVIEPKQLPYLALFLQLLSKKPNLTQLVSGPGIPIFIALLTPSTIEEISLNTGYKKSVIYKFIHDARQRSLLKNESSIYSLNDKLWLDFREVLEEIKKTELNIDSRVPITSIIYFKNQKEIIYSNKDDLIAELTAFSAYEDFGIKLLTITYYYYLPQKILTKREVFIHSLYVTEKDFSIQHLIFIALFLAKYKEELSDIKHTIVVNLLKVFLGEKIKGYPSISEIKDRAEIYGIEV